MVVVENIAFLNAKIVYLCAESTETELRTVKHIIQSWKLMVNDHLCGRNVVEKHPEWSWWTSLKHLEKSVEKQ